MDKKNLILFQCSLCGHCCNNLTIEDRLVLAWQLRTFSLLYNKKCKYISAKSGCLIYDSRPDLCRNYECGTCKIIESRWEKMRKSKKILRPFTGTGAVFFPVGLPPKGTCYFITEDCKQSCYAVDPLDYNFDEQLRLSKQDKDKILSFFESEEIDIICDQIISDLDGLQTPILHWFGSGDCPPDMLDKISTIIESLPDDIVQMGFTRNKILWQKYKDIFALTIEDESEATDVNAMYAIPRYEEQISVMYSPSHQVRAGYCGPLTCRDIRRDKSELEHYINCQTCLRLKIGCFDRN